MSDHGAVVITAGTVGAAVLSIAGGLNAEAVIGSFFGAMAFVMLSQEYGLVTRLLLLPTSWAAGYFCRNLMPEGNEGLSALIGAVLFVTLASTAISSIREGRLPDWLPWGRK